LCSAESTRMQDVMSHMPQTIPPEMSITEALGLMHANHFMHLPVVKEGDLEVLGLLDVQQLTLAAIDLTTEDDATPGRADAGALSAPTQGSCLGFG